MKTFKHKKIVITGGGSGIGKALIGRLYQQGARDFAVIGRNFDKLKLLEPEFPKANFTLFQGDVSKIEDLREFSGSVTQSLGGIDVLINNAGVVSAGPLEKIPDRDIVSQQNINVTGLILLTKYFLPFLKESKEAAIINVASGIALIGLPFYAPYAPSKGAVKMFSEALRRELKNYPIQVMTVYPTATETPMMATADMGPMDTPEVVAEKTIEGLMDNLIDVVLSNQEDVELNRNNPVEYDKKVATIVDSLSQRAAGHRSM